MSLTAAAAGPSSRTGGFRCAHAVDPGYDVSRLAADALALLDAKSPVIVHMEDDSSRGAVRTRVPDGRQALLAALENRARVPGANGPLAVFDFGYLVETYRQAGVSVDGDIDGYRWVQKAIALTEDPQTEFAAAIISRWSGAER